MIIVGVDPGSKRIGVARLLDKVPEDWETVTSFAALRSFMFKQTPDVVVCEDFILMGEDSHLNKESILTIKIIGRIHGWCDERGIRFVTQPNRCHALGAQFSGQMVLKSRKDNDAISALNHALYFAHLGETKNGVSGGKPKRPKRPWER